MLIGIRKLCRIIEVVLHRKSLFGIQTMSDYRGILDYRGVGLERFQCIGLLCNSAVCAKCVGKNNENI